MGENLIWMEENLIWLMIEENSCRKWNLKY